MKFLTPCFVRVENPQERKELIEWLEGIGYYTNHIGCNHNNIYENVLHVSSSRLYTIETNVDFPYLGAHNCDTNIELFKALAAMNDENDREQYFIDQRDGSMNFSKHGDIGLSALVYEKATAEEIINYFKNQRS